MKPAKSFALCIDNSDYRASLIPGKVYPIISDPQAAKDAARRGNSETGLLAARDRVAETILVAVAAGAPLGYDGHRRIVKTASVFFCVFLSPAVLFCVVLWPALLVCSRSFSVNPLRRTYGR